MGERTRKVKFSNVQHKRTSNKCKKVLTHWAISTMVGSKKKGDTEETVVSYKANGNGDILHEIALLPGHPQHSNVFRQHELAVS